MTLRELLTFIKENYTESELDEKVVWQFMTKNDVDNEMSDDDWAIVCDNDVISGHISEEMRRIVLDGLNTEENEDEHQLQIPRI